MKNVIVFGSLNMDLSIESDHMPILGETIIGSGFVTNPGGKGANQAVAASKLGANVYMIGSVGEDAFGESMLDSLSEAEIDCSFISRTSSAPTGVALITRVKGDNFITIDSGANFKTDLAHICTALDAVAQEGDIFVSQLECDFETTIEALKEAKNRQLLTVLNPAPARALPHELFSYLDVIVVNESECELLTGIYPQDNATTQNALQLFTDWGVATTIITLGERGSVICSQGKTLTSIPPCVQAIDTTCAGDTYLGALVASQARGLSLEESVKVATKASALATTKVGAQQSIPTLEEVL